MQLWVVFCCLLMWCETDVGIQRVKRKKVECLSSSTSPGCSRHLQRHGCSVYSCHCGFTLKLQIKSTLSFQFLEKSKIKVRVALRTGLRAVNPILKTISEITVFESFSGRKFKLFMEKKINEIE